jgi:hypothetical protein
VSRLFLSNGDCHGRIPTVRSQRQARDLAARCENRSIANIVERALEAYEAYEAREAGREPAASFYARLPRDYGVDVDLETVIRDARRVEPGPDL